MMRPPPRSTLFPYTTVSRSGLSEGTATISVTISHDATTAQVVTDTANISDPNVAATVGKALRGTPVTPAPTMVTAATYNNPTIPTPVTNEQPNDLSANIKSR